MTSKRVSVLILFAVGILLGVGAASWLIPAPDMPEVADSTEPTEADAQPDAAEEPQDDAKTVADNTPAVEAPQPEEAKDTPAVENTDDSADAKPAAVVVEAPAQPTPGNEEPVPAVAVAPSKPEPPAAPEKTGDLPNGWKQASFKVNGALYDSLYRALEPQGFTRTQSDIIAAHLKRLLIWKLPKLRRHVQAGDSVDMIFTEDATVSDGWRVLALKYHSMKLRDTIWAFYHQPDGQRFGAFYNKEGVDIAKTMTNAPVKEYEQITALLGDGRRHKGIDFKAPVGIPIYAPEKARVLRKNWKLRGNGRCLELRFIRSGVTALFLHLDEIPAGIKAGSLVQKGQKIATVGNTGRSYAPHLHYQLEKPKGRVMDPFKFHGSSQKRLRGKELAAFIQSIKKFDPYID